MDVRTPRTREGPAHALPPEAVAAGLDIDSGRGLDEREALARLETRGPNELPAPRREPFALRAARQFVEPMALLLIAAAVVDGIGLGERVDAIAILSIVVINAIIALVQEGRAARALEALRSMEAPLTTVLREGRARPIPSREVVPGDVLVLTSGDQVPADARLIEAAAMEVDESLLTGESLAVSKDPHAAVDPEAGVADRPTMVHSGTLVTRGGGRAVTTGTGRDTTLGEIAVRLGGREVRTPLQVDLGRLSKRLGAIAVAIALGVMLLTLARMGVSEESVERAFLVAVALAVAAVPEGLATVVTVSLALGVRRMAARGAIVRRLPAVETLGSTTAILTDKTGTLTENRMHLELAVVPGEEPKDLDRLAADVRGRLREVAVLCNDARLDPPAGDPLEVALLEAFGPGVEELREAWPRVAEVPFDSERKRMTTVHRGARGWALLVKGAPEVVVERSTWTIDGGGRRPLGEDERGRLLALASAVAGRGMRTLALARRSLEAAPEDPAAEERELTLLGLVGFRDPVRAEAPAAVAETRSAGIDLVMVTGDHAGTARAIARDVGLSDAEPLTGTDLRRRGVPARPLASPIYARVDPDQKLELVERLQGQGHVVAVTGDGVNDAPALRRADIGVAMGRAGSDVAREASDMIVTDDNLATIVTAVREGRGIYDNIRKVVDYLVAGNLSEIAVVVAALILFPELGAPLLPLQLLWINLLTDGLPAIALSVDRPHPALMRRPPRPRDERLLGLRRVGLLSWRGALIATSSVGSLAVGRYAWDLDWEQARSLMFTVLLTAHLLYAFVVRWSGHGRAGPNRWLGTAIAASLGLQLLIVSWPAAHDLFGTTTLSLRDWAAVLVGAILPVAVMALLRGREPFGQARTDERSDPEGAADRMAP